MVAWLELALILHKLWGNFLSLKRWINQFRKERKVHTHTATQYPGVTQQPQQPVGLMRIVVVTVIAFVVLMGITYFTATTGLFGRPQLRGVYVLTMAVLALSAGFIAYLMARNVELQDQIDSSANASADPFLAVIRQKFGTTDVFVNFITDMEGLQNRQLASLNDLDTKTVPLRTDLDNLRSDFDAHATHPK